MKYEVLERFKWYPSTIIKTIWYSLKYGKKSFKIPIVASIVTKIKLKKGAEIIQEKDRLVLGFYFTTIGEVGQIKYDKTIIHLNRDSKLILKGQVNLGSGVRVIAGKNAKVTIGSNTAITANSKIFCKNEINIGNNCAISWDVTIMDTDFHSIVENGWEKEKESPVNIGNHVWIGCGAKILKGVTIGDNSVVAANAIVVKDVPPNTIVAGNPAKVIKKNINWNE